MPNSVVLIISERKNLAAGISTSETINDSADVAAPYILVSNPPRPILFSVIFRPDLMVINPERDNFGVKLSLLNIITGISSM